MAAKNKGNKRRLVFAILSIIFSVLILLLTVSAISGVWMFHNVTINITSSALDEAKNIVQIGRNAIDRLEGGIVRTRQAVSEVALATERIGQDTDNRVLVSALLPSDKEQQLQTVAQQITDFQTFSRETVQAASGLGKTIDLLPFVSLPVPDQERIGDIDAKISSVREGLDELKNYVVQIREGIMVNVEQISNIALNIDNELGAVQQNLNQIDGQMAAIQTKADQLKQRLSIMLTVAAIIITLLAVWVGYGMILIIRLNWRRMRGSNKCDL